MSTGLPILIGAIVIGALAIAMAQPVSSINFDALSAQGIPQDDIDRLKKLYNALAKTGLSQNQILFCLSQALHETGLFTSYANYNLMDNFNNYAGITGNSRYPAGPGSIYADYPTIDDFVTDWIY